MDPVRITAIIEANVITGPAKNLLELARLARSLSQPIHITAITFSRSGSSTQFAAAAAAQNTPVHVIEERGRLDLAVLPRLNQLLTETRPHIVQTHAVKSHFLLRMSKAYSRLPWVAFHHGYTATDLRMLCYNQLDRFSLPGASAIATVCQFFAQQLLSRGVKPDRIEVFHNAIDPDWGAVGERESVGGAIRSQLEIPAGHPILLYTGRLSREKDPLTLLKAFGLLPAVHPAPYLVYLGNGPEEKILQTAAQPGVKERIRFAGHQPSAAPYYAAADLMIMPSLSEGSPNALLEAMATAVPVVATTVGGIPEIVRNNEHALLVPPANPQALAQAIGQLLGDPDTAKRLAEQARQHLIESFTTGTRVARLAQFYHRLAKP